jgi:hypothetical protein
MYTGAAVLPLVTRGKDEASTTRRPSTPRLLLLPLTKGHPFL